MKNKQQFEQIFRENYTRLYFHALNFLNDSEIARDVVNDVFEHVWVHYEKYELNGSVTPLLYTLVRNQAVNWVRHRKVEKEFQQKALSDSLLYDQDYSEFEDLIQQLRKAISQLPSQTQIVFRACFLEGKKYLQVAEELNISVNTVKTHISKALRILRRDFKGKNLLLLFLKLRFLP